MIPASPLAQSLPKLCGLSGFPSILTTTPLTRWINIPHPLPHILQTLGIRISSPVGTDRVEVGNASIVLLIGSRAVVSHLLSRVGEDQLMPELFQVTLPCQKRLGIYEDGVETTIHIGGISLYARVARDPLPQPKDLLPFD